MGLWGCLGLGCKGEAPERAVAWRAFRALGFRVGLGLLPDGILAFMRLLRLPLHSRTIIVQRRASVDRVELSFEAS